MDIYKILTDSAREFGQKPAIVFKDSPVSFEDLRAEVFALAKILQSKGVTKGTKIAVYLPNCPEYVYCYLSSFLLGAVVVPLDYMFKSDELIACCSHAETEFALMLEKPEIDWQLIRKDVPSLRTVIALSIGGLSLLMKNQEGQSPICAVSEDDPALIMYTSGTTGNPKGILLNYRHLDGSPEAMKYFVDLKPQDVKLCAIPLSHIGGFIYIQNCIMFGITLVLMERFHPLEFLKNVAKYNVTCFHIVPPMYTALLTLKDIGQFDLSSLRWVVVFGAPSAPDILERFHRYCPGAKLLNGWGMTETCPPNTVTPLDCSNIASVGKPAPSCEIQIVDDNDQPLEADEVGEIVIRGWVVMREYYKDPQATEMAKRHGWFHTGDLGRFDNEGFLYIVGRKKEMIKVAGQIVYAPEVEAALCKYEAVSEAAVIGVPDDMRGEAVKAFVVLKDGAQAAPLDIKYFAKDHLANFKVPHTVEICKALPKNRVGKIDKEVLKRVCLSPHTRE